MCRCVYVVSGLFAVLTPGGEEVLQIRLHLWSTAGFGRQLVPGLGGEPLVPVVAVVRVHESVYRRLHFLSVHK